MERNNSLTATLPLVLGIAAVVWMLAAQPSVSGPSKKARSSAAEDPLPDKKELTVLLNTLSSFKDPDDGSAVWGDRNPFDVQVAGEKANSPKAKTSTGYRLSGIFWNEIKPSAIINGLVVSVGSMVGLAKVKEIAQDKVVLSDGNNDVVLISGSGDR